MNNFTVGVLTISDRCHLNEAVDESGPALVKLIEDGTVKNGTVAKTYLVPDCQEVIAKVLKQWCYENVTLILTTGGTGVSERDVTPEATAAVLEKTVPGISHLMFNETSKLTPLAALSRGIAGVRGRSLIINLPGSKKACKECLKAIAGVIPHAIDLIMGNQREVDSAHMQLRKKSSVVENRVIFRDRKSPYPLISVEEAQEIIVEKVNLLKIEKTINSSEALGHVLAQDVIAFNNHPPVDLSLKDGYAVRSADEMGLRNLVSVSKTGELPFGISVPPNGCVRVSTGGPIPPGADSVVEVEKTQIESLNNELSEERRIVFNISPRSGSNIRKKGSDYSLGKVLLKFGTYIDSAAAGVLATAGFTSVRVFCKPKVAIMSTGDELLSPTEILKPGKVHDSNRVTLMALLKEENFKTVDLGIVPDNPDLLRDSLERGFRAADVVVTTGSMSMGERDYLKEIIVADFNGEICFGRVFLKPGKPTSFGILNFEGKQKVWFGLPGNPASAVVTSHLFLLPALRRIGGMQEVFPPSVRVSLANNSFEPEDRPHYVRASVKYNLERGIYTATVNENQSSSWIGSCVNANALILIPSSSISSATYKALMIGKNTFRA